MHVCLTQATRRRLSAQAKAIPQNIRAQQQLNKEAPYICHPKTRLAMLKPFNLRSWIDENRHLLQPPVGNKQVYLENDDFIVMIVGGPNGRKDYHWEEGEELFYQLEGDIQVKIINEDGKRETIDIREGEMFLLPPRIPHSPQRPGAVRAQRPALSPLV